MAEITKESFEATIKSLLSANSRNSSKGKIMKEWFQESFSIKAAVSNVKEDKQIGNRIAEQFKHKAPIVVFVCDEGVNYNNLVSRAIQQRYTSLNTLLIIVVSNDSEFRYERLYNKANDSFSEWAEKTLGLTVIPLVNKKDADDLSLQQIYYGAPGTGKSHHIDDVVCVYPHVRTTFHPDSDYATFVGAYKPTMKTNTISRNGVTTTEEQIIYSFVPQAFLKAYVNAWKQMPKPYFLVIEEINRGNCAQIFGDLFQLLDRDDEGFSKYSIEADEDIKRFLSLDKANGFAALTDEQKKQFPEDAIWKGEKLVLPKNLHIWASMNTSDQSLFPIDSAFKRRWDWKYVPIADGGKEWKIEACGQQYDWWEFLEEMNAIVEDATSSEDKKLGYYFTKADEDGVISAEKFVSKVVFYLWNDVFKDYGFDRNNANGKPIFKDANGKDMTFRSFFKPNGDIQETQVKLLFENMLLSTSSDEEDNDDDEDGGDASGKDFTRYSINGNGQISKRQLAYQLISEYIRLNPSLTATEVVSNWKALGTFVTHFVETQSEFESRTDNNPRVMAADCNGEKVYVSTNGWGTKGVMQALIDSVNNQDWGLHVEEIG